MTNSRGYLMERVFKYSFIIFFTLISFLLFTNQSYAVTGLKELKSITYTLDNSGNLSTEYTVKLRNSTSTSIVLTSYHFPIPYTSLNDAKITVGSSKYKYSTQNKTKYTQIYLSLNNEVVPAKGDLDIKVRFTTDKYVKDLQDIVSFSLLANIVDGDSVDVILKYPNTWADIIKSNIGYTKTSSGSLKVVNFAKTGTNNVLVILGSQVVYQFDIEKIFTNDVNEKRIFEVNIPFSSNGQIAVFNSISPIPDNVYTDRSGNRVFIYNVDAQSSKRVSIQGSIRYDTATTSRIDSISNYTKLSGYWLFTNESEILRLKQYLMDIGVKDVNNPLENESDRLKTYRAVNDYVVKRLTPLKSSTVSTYSQRKGTDNVVVDRINSSNEDYVDMLISSYRKVGIPARMIIGYIPDSDATKGYYHSWVQYWDVDKGTWRNADPYLEDLRGNKYFGVNFDDRIVVLVREFDSIVPNISYLSDDEINISAGKKEVGVYNSLDINLKQNIYLPWLSHLTGIIEIGNKGNSIITITDISFKSDDDKTILNNALARTGEILPTQSAKFDFSINRVNIPTKVVVKYIDGTGIEQQTVKQVTINSKTPIYWQLVIYTSIFLLIISIISILRYLISKTKWRI